MLNQKEGHSKVEEDDFTLNTSSAEPLELDDHYTKQKSICWGGKEVLLLLLDHIVIQDVIQGPLFICAFLSFFIMGGLFIFLRIDEDPLIFYTTLIISINQCISYLIVALINPGVANIERVDIEKNEETSQKHGKLFCYGKVLQGVQVDSEQRNLALLRL